MNYPCSCCHHYTRDQPSGNFDFEICPVCFWEDDPVQNIHPNSKSGANAISLAEAQDNYQQYTVSELRFLKHVRKPNDLERNDEKQNEHISKNKTIQIDGSQGEGGGQILRTALSLSMLTGIPFELVNIRAGRKKPGLMRQHLVCVQASQRISNAIVEGAELHSQKLYFQPQQVQAGKYDFHIGSAGSTILVLQTLLPALMMQNEISHISIHGGTHNPMAPTADFIESCFLPALHKLGIKVDFECERAGFFPIGAGQINITTYPWIDKLEYSVLDKGKLLEIHGYAAALNIQQNIADRELEVLHNKLSLSQRNRLNFQGISQGNTAFVVLNYQHHQQVFSALGEMKKSAEKVAHDLAKEVKSFLACDAVADEYLADQLLLPLALGKGGAFTAQVVSEHTTTQAEMIQKFLDCEIHFEAINDIFKVSVIT